ncbi:hypothetical protein Nepgr_027480 [Nepenthes gracilis]|uniref:Uncharacterized protein n=1 Tax=Nepenthes gracilis TaxID=150966 RepID=A0AAD3TBT7_NEPGR|nr:hypothetical protein Nepgr_027480 [Nepenthes gracilis]
MAYSELQRGVKEKPKHLSSHSPEEKPETSQSFAAAVERFDLEWVQRELILKMANKERNNVKPNKSHRHEYVKTDGLSGSRSYFYLIDALPFHR